MVMIWVCVSIGLIKSKSGQLPASHADTAVCDSIPREGSAGGGAYSYSDRARADGILVDVQGTSSHGAEITCHGRLPGDIYAYSQDEITPPLRVA